MRNESVGSAGGFVMLSGVAVAGLGGVLTAERHGSRTMLVNSAEQSLAAAKTRLTTVAPTLFGPDSPQELADAIRGAEEALPGLKAATRTSKLLLASTVASGVAMVFGGAAIVSWGYGDA